MADRDVGVAVKFVHVFKDKQGEWRWTACAANHEPLADSDEGYVNHSECRGAAESLFPGAEFEDEAAPRFDASRIVGSDEDRTIWDINQVAAESVSLALRIDTTDERILSVIETAAADNGIELVRRENPIT